MMNQISIAVIGSCNIDVVVEAPKRPLAGETILGNRLIIAQGGKGANQAVAAARLGAKVYMVGCVGDDDYGRSVLKNFEANGVNSDYVKTVEGVTTGTAHITLAEGDNSIIVIKGANDLVTPALIDEAWPQIAKCDMVMLQHEIPAETIAYALKKCKEAGVKALLNPAPVLDGAKEWAQDAAFVTPNEHEAQALFPGKTTEQILLENEGRLLMTLGSKGVAYAENGVINTVPAFKVEAVDTTGAGDTFNSAFAVAKASGKNMSESITFANAAAALSVQKIGAQGGMPYLDEVEGMLSECRK